MELQCESCNYRFDSQKKPLRCPFCGKENTIREIPSAEEIMEEVLNELKKKTTS